MLINKQEKTSFKNFTDSNAFIEYSNDIDNNNIKILKNIIQIKNEKYWLFQMPSFVLFSHVFDAIPDMLSNKKINPIVTELFIRCRNLNISLVFITQFYLAEPKTLD